MFMGFSLTNILYTSRKSAGGRRVTDVIDVIFNLSLLLMLLGVSNSIKRALKTQRMHENVVRKTVSINESILKKSG